MGTLESFVAAARQNLVSGKKKKTLSESSCLNLAVQVLAIDSGLKPALVYDVNSAEPHQVQQYLCKLRALGLVSDALDVITIDDNVLIINKDVIIPHLEELLSKKHLAVIDVSKSRHEPALVTVASSGIEESIRSILRSLRTLERDGPGIHDVGEEGYAAWNLSSVYGILLGFPATYWFDHKASFENCLSMVQLVVTSAMVSWDVVGGNMHAFSSFSVPLALMPETQSLVDAWTENLRKRFAVQSIFSTLSFSSEIVCLPSISL